MLRQKALCAYWRKCQCGREIPSPGFGSRKKLNESYAFLFAAAPVTLDSSQYTNHGLHCTLPSLDSPEASSKTLWAGLFRLRRVKCPDVKNDSRQRPTMLLLRDKKTGRLYLLPTSI